MESGWVTGIQQRIGVADSSSQGFADPAQMTFTYPAVAGVAYALCASVSSLSHGQYLLKRSSEDYFYELSRYRFISNGMSQRDAQNQLSD